MHKPNLPLSSKQSSAARVADACGGYGSRTLPPRLIRRSARAGAGALLGLLVAVMAGCSAAPPSSAGVASVREGVVESVAQVAPRRFSALTGMMVGGVIGNGECGAENRMVGLALGALGSAWAANSSGLDPRGQGYRVTVRLDDGGVEHLQNSDPIGITVGQRVMIGGHKLVRPSALSGDASPAPSPAR